MPWWRKREANKQEGKKTASWKIWILKRNSLNVIKLYALCKHNCINETLVFLSFFLPLSHSVGWSLARSLAFISFNNNIKYDFVIKNDFISLMKMCYPLQNGTHTFFSLYLSSASNNLFLFIFISLALLFKISLIF